ncbi:adenosine deaminase [Ramlibacter sp. AW1]|uniref:Adenine deaminase n=1 Tax=Ramlibacter aurantiacus TaxID=2801330 RepID=A0A936ZS61_9BURK|nr:adenosine deaminase [Ramlibacter aurantiacus]
MTPAEFIAGLPKAELHMHIEGSIEAPLFMQLARRNEVAIRWATEQELLAAYRFRDLQAFLDLYYDGCRVLVHARDFHDVTRAYLRRAHADNVRHAEMFLGPQGHTSRGVALRTVLEGVFAAMDEARAEVGISSGLILVAQRHRSEAEAFELYEQAMPWRDRILGFGLGGAEVGNPPSKFERFFRRCRDDGFHVVAHAGEEGPAAYVRESVELLGVERVDHGNASLQDAALLRTLAQRQTPLTVCPLSNLKLNVVSSIEAHPLKQLMDAGLRVTVNSDDPSYFGGYVNDNYVACQRALGLTRHEVVQLARNSVLASFVPEARQRELLAEIEAYESRAGAWIG